jgi:hypothetical protein
MHCDIEIEDASGDRTAPGEFDIDIEECESEGDNA